MNAASIGNLRVLVIGRDGQIGAELLHSLAGLGNVTTTSRADLELTSDASIRDVVCRTQPHLIVNAAAYTAVDKAESEPDLAQRINGDAVAALAAEAKLIGAAMIHYSTDYVFDGSKSTPYVEQDATCPLSVYGRTKLAGEQALANAGIPYLILRTSWVYGTREKNFLLTILKLAMEKPELRIVDDQIGAPTWSHDIAEATASITRSWIKDTENHSGIYHLTAMGETSWYGFATEAIRLRAFEVASQSFARLLPIPTLEYPTPATRPKNSRLNCNKVRDIFHVQLPEWKNSLAKVVPSIH